MKKVIRLTENDLHRIVKNSVKKVLTELDWKTYHSAAKKSSTNPTRASKFSQAAEKAFNKQYGFNDSEDLYGSDYYAGSVSKKYGLDDSTPQYPSTKLRLKPSWSDKEDVYSYNPGSSEEFPLGSFKKNYNYDIPYGNANPKYQFGDGDAGNGFMARKAATHGETKGPQNIDLGNQELYDFENDNYEYQKGKGWQKKK